MQHFNISPYLNDVRADTLSLKTWYA